MNSARVHSSLGVSSSGSTGKLHSTREELISKRYNLVEPQGVFPLDGISNNQSTSSSNTTSSSQGFQSQLQIQQLQQIQLTPRYPDFQPWRHTAKEDEIAVSHLQKGYLETPSVGNELLSARNIMHQLLRSKNSLEELSSNLLKTISVRATNNTIGQGSFKPPPRVTLTDQKREQWLRDLANDKIPLRKLSRTIPHGVRNKILLEQCTSKNIPMSRAIWLVRCISTNELRGLKRKGGANIEFNWVQEWTTQVVEYIEKLSLDYLKFETFQQATDSWKFNISYILRFISNLYIENLVDHDGFKNWLCKFFKSCKNFELPLCLTIIKIFWDELIKTDYLIKELTENLVLRYQKVLNLENMLDSKDQKITDIKLNDQIKMKLLNNTKELILESFNVSIDNFILPNNWDSIKTTLESILDLNDESIKNKFELISYRNQSLMINYSLNQDVVVNDLVTILDNLKNNEIIDYKQLIDFIFNSNWKENLEVLIYWSITKYRNENYRIYLTIEILKKVKSSTKEIEQLIMDIVFKLHLQSQVVNFKNLFVLLNELSNIKLFKTSIYMRRLISSGLVYLSSNNNEKFIHSLILKNLKPDKKSNQNIVLKNLSQEEINLGEKIIKGLNLLNSVSIDDIEELENYEVGVKLTISDSYFKGLLNDTNLFPLLTYKEFERILKSFIVLNDYKKLIEFIIKSLESGELDKQEIELIIEILITNIILFNVFDQLEKVIELILLNKKSSNIDKLKNLNLNLKNDSLKQQLLLNQQQSQSQNSNDQSNILLEIIPQSGLNLTINDFNNNQFHNTFQLLIKSIFNDSIEQNKRMIIIDLLLYLKQINPIELNKILFVYIKKTYTNSSDLFKFEPLLDLINSELIGIGLVIDTFLNFNSTIFTSFILDLLFKEFSIDSFDNFKLNLLRQEYKNNHPESILNLISICLTDEDPATSNIQSESTSLLMNSLLPDNLTQYKSQFLIILQNNLIHNPDLLVDVPLNSSSKIKLISLLNEMVDIENELDLNKLNRFNLPIFQLLFKLNFDINMSDEAINYVINSIFNNVNVENSNKNNNNNNNNNHLFGSLFKLLKGELKLKFINQFESLFLNSSTFPNVFINGKIIDLTIISDILTILSKNSQNLGLKEDLIFSLDSSLESLLKIVNSNSSENHLSQQIYDSIFLFLKIIIIHKSFLINIISERNSIKESFLNNIVALLSTNLVNQNLQLKNLLYDLIISIKSNVNELNSNTNNIIKLPLSIVNLPAISSSNIQHKEIFQNVDQNLNDFSVINTLFLYQKTNSTYHDFNFKPFDLLEDSNPIENINDTAISLQLFEASLERKNPT